MFEEPFQALVEHVTGWDVDKFTFERGVQPLSTNAIVGWTMLVYVVGILTLDKLAERSGMRPMNWLKPVMIVYNLFISFFSLVLLVVMLENLLPKILGRGLHYAMCAPHMFDSGRLQLYYYLNYLVKYLELFDTLFYVAKRRQIIFLHIYHHAATLFLTFTQQVGQTAIQWVPITLNLLVHVIMYYYYALTVAGVSPWWKKYVTTFQIVQFVIDIVAVYYGTFFKITVGVYNAATNTGCYGGLNAAYFGCFLLSSYLVLFIDFFRKTYSAKKPAAVKDAKKSK